MSGEAERLAVWRSEMASGLASADVAISSRALLELTYDEPDRTRIEGILLACVEFGNEPQLRALAVTCMGHVARIHGAAGSELAKVLKKLLADPILGGRAEDALDDIRSFTGDG
ncbi:hypothetical protein [Kitasatospora sp. P5_F3]